MNHLSIGIYIELLFLEQLSSITRVNVYACYQFIQTSFVIVQMVVETSGSQCLYKDPIQLILIQCLYKDPNQ